MIKNFLRQINIAWSTLKQLPDFVVVPIAIGCTGLVVTGMLLAVRQAGGLERPELIAHDHMVRFRHDAPPDPRIVVVAVTEADIQAQKRWPLSDMTVATLLQQLQRYQPRVIGLDIYRDLPQEPGHKALNAQLKQPNVVGITKIPDPEDLGVPAPPAMVENQIGFNDITTDTDGIVRRNLIFADSEAGVVLHSFSLRLALAYLQAENILPKPSPNNPNYLQFGAAEFLPLDSGSGGYQAIDAKGYQVLLNYRNRKSLARTVPLSQVLSGSASPDWFKDKIVLIGTTARSARDTFLTPYSAGEKETPLMAGVIIHGQAVSQILDAALGQRPLFWYWSDWMEVLWIGTWTLLGGSLAWVIRNPFALTMITTSGLAGLVGACYVIFLHQGWIPVASPALGFLSMSGLVITYQSQQAQRQQKMMMKLLGQNTSPEIADALWNSRDRLLKSGKLPGQRLFATMLFTDIKNFSTISEQMPPENLLEWLNEYLSAITKEVTTRQGIINKFTGDGMLAVFGVPVNRTTPIGVAEDARHAVACALAMGDRLAELNQGWEKQGLPTVQMRVGIFTGPVVVGSLGGKDRLEYGVIGDSVNIASRLESYEKDRHLDSELCRTLIAQETLMHLNGQFEVEHWGPLALKGKHEKVDVYRVMGYASVPIPCFNQDKPLDGNLTTKEAI